MAFRMKAVEPKTSDAYIRGGLLPFLWYLAETEQGYSTYVELDEAVEAYVYHVHTAKLPVNRATYLTAALKLLDPHSANKLVCTALAVRALKRLRPPKSRIPMPWEVAALYAFGIRTSRLSWALEVSLGLLLCFDCYLRVSELVGIKRKHVVFSLKGGVRTATIRIPKSKTGRNQSVTVRRTKLVDRLHTHARDLHRKDYLFPFSAQTFRDRMYRMEAQYGIPYHFTPHCLRHGGATHDFDEGISFERIMVRGRWKEASSTRHYIHTGVSLQLTLQLPPAIRAILSGSGSVGSVIFTMLETADEEAAEARRLLLW